MEYFTIFHIVKFFLPFLRQWSGILSFSCLIIWIFQMISKKHIHNLDVKAKKKYKAQLLTAAAYNEQNKEVKVAPNNTWMDNYIYYLRRRYLTLYLSLMFAYLSFNINAYYETSSDSFYKLLAISTTLFLSGLSLLREKHKS